MFNLNQTQQTCSTWVHSSLNSTNCNGSNAKCWDLMILDKKKSSYMIHKTITAKVTLNKLLFFFFFFFSNTIYWDTLDIKVNALRFGGKTSSVWVKVNSRRNKRESEVFTFQMFLNFCSLLSATQQDNIKFWFCSLSWWIAGICSNARTRKATKWGQRIPWYLRTFSFGSNCKIYSLCFTFWYFSILSLTFIISIF